MSFVQLVEVVATMIWCSSSTAICGL